MHTTGAESRKFARFDIDLSVWVVGKAGAFQARLINISMGGCQMVGSLRARVGEILAIKCGEIVSPEIFRTRVQWAVPGEGGCSFGSSFWGADDRAKREIIQHLIAVARPSDPALQLMFT